MTAHPRSWHWPNGEKITISIGLAFEAFETHSQFTSSVAGSRKVNHFSLSYAEYGWKAGAWRLLRFLERCGIRAQVYTSGLAAEGHPEVVSAMVQAGHEIVGHGWVNDRSASDEDPDGELAEIKRCTRAITAATSVRPIGWLSPGYSGTRNTAEFLKAEGYVWTGDDASDDLPFLRETSNGPIVVLPVTGYACNDLGMWIRPRNPPNVIWEGFKDTFDFVYQEGCDGAPKWIEIVLHCHIGGRPTLLPTIQRCIDYARNHDVWFARRCDIAEWTLKRGQQGG
jgi:peptidoglycan/xylan/chitin deacetylase (PgdA/CDA1 family)